MFWNKVYCFYHFWILIKICSDFLRKSTARWSKLHSTSTDDPAEKEEQLSSKTHNFLSCFVNSSVKFTEIGENFMHVCKNCILHVQTIQKKIDVWRKAYCFYHFWILIKICSELLRKSTARWSKLHYTSTDGPAEKEEKISWITHNFLHFFEISSVNFTEFGVEVSCTVVKTAFYMYEGTIREKFDVGEKKLLFLSLSKFNQKMFGVLAEKFRHGVQNCLSRLQMILPRKTIKSLE